MCGCDKKMTGGTTTSPSPAMQAVYTGAIGGAIGALVYGMEGSVPLPGGYQLSAPVGLAVHTGLASFVSDSYLAKPLNDYLTKMTYTKVAPYSGDVTTAAVTPALLMVAGDQTVTPLAGALIGGVSHAVAEMINGPVSWDGSGSGGKTSAAVYGGARMYSSGVGYQYGSPLASASNRGQTASVYAQRY